MTTDTGPGWCGDREYYRNLGKELAADVASQVRSGSVSPLVEDPHVYYASHLEHAEGVPTEAARQIAKAEVAKLKDNL